MDATGIRNFIVAIFLVIISVLMGTYAAEDKDIPILMIAVFLGIIFMLFLGRRAWGAIYIFPPLIPYLPIGILQMLPGGFLVAGGVLAYWVVMRVMGYVQFQWRTLWILDILTAVLLLYFVVSFANHPVAINALGVDAEYVGGKEYVWAILAPIYYVALSSIPCTYEGLYKVLRWSFWLLLAASVFAVVMGMMGLAQSGDTGEAITNSRFSMFAGVGTLCFYILFSKKSIPQVLASPKLLLVAFLCVVAVVISGWREKLLMFCTSAMALFVIKRELIYMVVISVLAYGMLLYLSHEKIVEEHFPFGMQRTLSMVPGVKIKDDVRRETEHSSEWRKVMWRWALDPRTGYIRDYVWGDGFGQSVAELNRYSTSLMRGTVMFGDQDDFARTGTWHNGPIMTIHRLGLVGLGIFTVIFLYGIFLVGRVCRAYRGTPMFLLAMVFLLDFYGEIAHFYISAGTIRRFLDVYIYLGLAKVLYCIGREEGLIIPMVSSSRYKPILISEQERRDLISQG